MMFDSTDEEVTSSVILVHNIKKRNAEERTLFDFARYASKEDFERFEVDFSGPESIIDAMRTWREQEAETLRWQESIKMKKVQ
jgi:hypothetical protein